MKQRSSSTEEEDERCLSRQKRLHGRLFVLESIIFSRLSALGALNKFLVFERGRLFEQFPAIVILFCNKTWRCSKGEFQLFIENLFKILRKLGLRGISISLSVKYFFWWRFAWSGRLFLPIGWAVIRGCRFFEVGRLIR